jgi:hypothetical protein
METPSKSVGDVFAGSWKAEEENLNSPEAQAAKTLAENLDASSLPGLKRLYEETTDAPARAMMEYFLREKTTELMQELSEVNGYENTLRWAAEKKRDNQIDDAFLEAAFEIIKEKARQPQPGVSMQDVIEFGKATPDVFDDLAKGLYGIIRYTPQAAFETAREIKIEELNRARKVLGMEPVKQPETPATKLLSYGALQGTYETGRLLQRLGRIVTLGVEDFDDESIRERFKEDLDLIDTMVSFERGQTKEKDEKTGEPVQVVAKEDVEMISPIGEFASIDNAASVGAGLLAKKFTKAGAKELSKRLVSAAPRLMTIAEQRAAQKAAEEAARQAVSLPRRAVGTAVESVGTAAQKVAESPVARGTIAGGITLASGGSVPAAAMAAMGGGSSVGRQVVKNVPGTITRTGKAIKAPITGPIGKLTEVVSDIQRGMIAGTATMAPLALPAETVEERATLLAGGAVAGGFGAGADVARNSVRQFGRSMWTPSSQVVPESQRAKTTAYGTADLDAAHAAYVSQLPADSANRIEALRDLIGDKNELYVIDPATYDSLDQTQAGGAKSSGVVYATGQNGRRIALVRGGSESLMHEVGHVVFNSLPASSQKQLRDAVLDGYTTEELEQMREYYTSRGIDLPDTDTLIEEVISENFQVALNGSPLSQLGTPGNLAARIYNSVGILAERVGLKGFVPGADVVTSQTLQFTPSFIAVNAINALRQAGQFDLAGTAGPVTTPGGPASAAPTPPEAVPTPAEAPVAPEAPPPAGVAPEAPAAPPPVGAAPAAPAAPAVTPISVTPAEPGQTTPRPARSIYTKPGQREAIAGPQEPEKRATPEVEEANRQTISTELEKLRGSRRPFEVSYSSAVEAEKPEASSDLTEPQRAEQRALADAGEAAGVGDQFREIYNKVMVPYKLRTTKTGSTTLFAFSLDKVIRNIDMLGGWLQRNPDAAARLARVTGVQSLESPEFRTQFQNYLQNQANGYRGDGLPLRTTPDTRPEDIPDPTPGYTPVPVPEGASRLINSLMGLRNAIDYGEGATASQSYVQRLAKANGAAVVEAREMPGRKAGETVTTNEFNLVNKELRDIGFDPKLFHVAIEQLRLNRIVDPVKVREDLNVRAPLQGVIQIGYMPAPAPNTPEFKNFFKDSKVVDAEGNPLPLYRGDRKDVGPVFRAGREGGSLGNGIYLTPDPEFASGYADDFGKSPGSGVVSKVYASLQNPLVLETTRRGQDPVVLGFIKLGMDPKKAEAFAEKQYEQKGYIYNQLKNKAVAAGHDGIMQFVDGELTEVVAFRPEQVKSATGNRGTFNPTNPDIRFMPAASAVQGRGIVNRGEDSRRFMPAGNDDTTQVASDYVRKAFRREYNPHTTYDQVPEDLLKEIADYFQNVAKHEPESPEVLRAYQAMADETIEQYKAMIDAGIEPEPYNGVGEPYASSEEMMRDVRDNKHLYFLRTDSAFGQGTQDTSNPLLKKSGLKIGDFELLVNDVFRIVHDYFGHTQQGLQFGPRGEFNAWKSHSRMYSDAAQGAVAAETLAQNAWVNFGQHLRRDDGSIPKKGDPDYVPPQDRPFGEQKNFLVPPELMQLEPDVPEPGMTAVREENANYFAPPTDEDARNALYETKRADYGAARSLPEGYPVELRIDIPAFKQTGNYVVTVHEKGEKSKVGTVIGYDNVAAVDNAVFSNKSEKVSQQIRDGVRNKTPLAVVSGEFNPAREMPADIENWTPVGFDPVKHSYFYDKTSGRPVVEAEKAISVGNTVFALNPTYAPRYKFQYMAAEPTGTPGVTETKPVVAVPSDPKAFQKVVKAIQKEPKTMASIAARVKDSEEYKEMVAGVSDLPPLDPARMQAEEDALAAGTEAEVNRRARARYKAQGGTLTSVTFSLLDATKTKASLAKNVIDTNPTRLFDKLDSAKEMLARDPERIASPAGFGEYMKAAGMSGDILSAPPMLGTMLQRPEDYVALLQGGYHGDRTKPGTMEAADTGLDSTVRMREAINGRPPELVTALHSLWGILSRMLAPIHQEAMWLRLVSTPYIMDQIQASVDGNFNLTKDEWKTMVRRAKLESDSFSDKLGNPGVSNANAFYLMLTALNGKWDLMSDVYAAPNSTEMGRRFWSLGVGKLGIRNKVQRFIGLTFGIPALIMDRWKFVEFYFQQFGKPPQDYFVYDSGNTPEDPNGIYGFYGPYEGKNNPLSLAMYEGFELAVNAAIANSSQLRTLLGRHANLGGMHWKGWNAIKNEAVGHSSLDLTYDLVRKNPNPTAQDVLDLVKTKDYYTEGLVGTEIKRFTLPRNR